MKEIKFRFRYRVQNPYGITTTHILTLEQLEKGNTFLNECFKFGWKILSRDRYIGFKDKNNKKIYEKDIIKNYFKLKVLEEINGKRIYEAKPKIYHIEDIRNLKNYELYEGMDMKDVEVIGNMHEHSEPLEGGKS